jgi:hypothetical protein
MRSAPIAWSDPENERHQQQAQSKKQDEAVGHDGGDEEASPADHHPVQKDDRHRILEHREGERAEEHHCRQQHPADHAAMIQEVRQLPNHCVGLSGDQPFEITPQGSEQFALVDDLRQRDQGEDE